MKKHILYVEDEVAIRQMIRFALEREGYHVTEAETAFAAREAVANQLPDLMLIDWMLPDLSGPELVKRFRKDEVTQAIPILMLTARSEEEDVIQGLEGGADDYLTKPVSLKTLSARVKALLRRSEGHAERKALTLGKLHLDMDAHQLTVGGQAIHLGITEYKLLEFFMKHVGRVYSRSQLLDFIWGRNTYIEERTVDVHILRLRKALKAHEADQYIQTVRGAGYRFSEEGVGET